MTLEKLIEAITTAGYRPRMTNWQDESESGWGVELFERNGRKFVADEETLQAALTDACRQAGIEIKP